MAPALLEEDDIGSVTAAASMDVWPSGEAVLVYLRHDGVGAQLWATILR